MIRHCVGVRGVCEGVPVAFDRHMNIVLRDVTERYVPFRTSTNGGVSETKRSKKRRKKKRHPSEEQELKDEPVAGHVTSSTSCAPLGTSSVFDDVTSSCGHMTPNTITRHVKQLFIRGDNVIMIHRSSSAMPPHPHS